MYRHFSCDSAVKENKGSNWREVQGSRGDILRLGATNACLKVNGKNLVRRKKGLPMKIIV